MTSGRPIPQIAHLAASVRVRIDDITDLLVGRIFDEMESYRSGVVSRDEVSRSMRTNLAFMLDQISGMGDRDLSVARDTGLRRGREGAPLPELLRAYRLGFHEIWSQLLHEARSAGAPAYESLVEAVTEIWSLADEYMQAVTDAYREAQADQAYAQARQRGVLAEAVLTGETTDHGTLWEIAERLRMPFEGAFLAVAAEPSGLGDSALARIEPRLAMLGVASAWRLLPGIELGLISLGQSDRHKQVLEAVTDLAQARVGISPEFARIDEAPRAARLARIAMRSAVPGTIAVQQFDSTPVAALAAADPESSQRVARAVLGNILALPDEEREMLLSTLDAWLDSMGSATEAGRRMYVHPNTVRHRLKRIEQHTGRQLDDPRGVADLAVALEITHIFPTD